MTDRQRQIERRQFRIHRGAAAETTKQHLDQVFSEVRDFLTEQFVKNSKQLGELDKGIGYELIALHDLRQRLEEQISSGRKAAAAVEKDLSDDAGGSAA